MLQDHPQGIIIDCSELERVSEDGAKTFLEAMHDIQLAGARMVVANLPQDVLQVIRTIPGVRSQLPIASSLEEARASLLLSAHAPSMDGQPLGENSILVPLVDCVDIGHTLAIAARFARDLRQQIVLVYLLQVALNLPLCTPLPEEELEANRRMEQAMHLAKTFNIHPAIHIERVRDPDEGLLQVIKKQKASHVIVASRADQANTEEFQTLLDLLLHRAPCDVLIGRRAPGAPTTPNA
ncbi:MAG: universal stress protein [Methanobacterium paludis]|nr:universal stress protein [Methanobacterium paludis]